MAFYEIGHTEQTWMNDELAFERNERQREERDMRDWQDNDLSREQVIAELSGMPQYCDGSGVLEERYIDVDQTEVVSCPGCIACDMELVEFVRRKPAGREIGKASERVA